MKEIAEKIHRNWTPRQLRGNLMSHIINGRSQLSKDILQFMSGREDVNRIIRMVRSNMGLQRAAPYEEMLLEVHTAALRKLRETKPPTGKPVRQKKLVIIDEPPPRKGAGSAGKKPDQDIQVRYGRRMKWAHQLIEAARQNPRLHEQILTGKYTAVPAGASKHMEWVRDVLQSQLPGGRTGPSETTAQAIGRPERHFVPAPPQSGEVGATPEDYHRPQPSRPGLARVPRGLFGLGQFSGWHLENLPETVWPRLEQHFERLPNGRFKDKLRQFLELPHVSRSLQEFFEDTGGASPQDLRRGDDPYQAWTRDKPFVPLRDRRKEGFAPGDFFERERLSPGAYRLRRKYQRRDKASDPDFFESSQKAQVLRVIFGNWRGIPGRDLKVYQLLRERIASSPHASFTAPVAKWDYLKKEWVTAQRKVNVAGRLIGQLKAYLRESYIAEFGLEPWIDSAMSFLKEERLWHRIYGVVQEPDKYGLQKGPRGYRDAPWLIARGDRLSGKQLGYDAEDLEESQEAANRAEFGTESVKDPKTGPSYAQRMLRAGSREELQGVWEEMTDKLFEPDMASPIRDIFSQRLREIASVNNPLADIYKQRAAALAVQQSP